MARTATRTSSWRDRVAHNSAQQRSKASNFGHLILPRGVPVFKEEGNTRVSLDILPYTVTDPNHPDKDEERGAAVEGSQWYRRPYKLHRSIGADNAALVCPTSIGKKCPICEHRQNLLNSGQANWQDEAMKKLRPSGRSIYYVVPIGHRKYDQRAHLWDISDFCFQAKLNDEIEENVDFGMFPDPAEGLTLKIRFTDQKIGSNSFAETSRIDFEQRNYAYGDEDIEGLATLDNVLEIKDYAEIRRAFFETGDIEPDDLDPPEDEVTEPAPRLRTIPRAGAASNGQAGQPTTRPTRRAAPPPEDEDDQQDDEPPEEEAEEEAAPPRRATRSVAPAAAPTRAAPTRSLTRPARPAAAPAEAEEPAPQQRRPLRRQTAAGAGQCPSGYAFGVDCDQHDECEACTVWQACYDAQAEAA
jgi:hypothetical protein